MVVDDSAAIRGALARILGGDPRIEVVARVANGQLALDWHARHPVDVVLLDIEMPVMDGLTALPLLLRADPSLRVIMASTLTTHGAEATLRALRLGAADYIAKPSAGEVGSGTFRTELLAKVAALRRRRPAPPPAVAVTVAAVATWVAPLRVSPPLRLVHRPAGGETPVLLAIGCSTGGPRALFELFEALPRSLGVPVVITQHMPPIFTKMLAAQLDRIGTLPCHEATDGEPLLPGHAYMAPGGQHLLVARATAGLRARLSSAPPENQCRPAVDPMLRSAVEACGARVLAVILTGMGQDGLLGTRAVLAAGGSALAQDEASSVVWGMPGAVARDGLCAAVLPVAALAREIAAIVGHGVPVRLPSLAARPTA